MLAALATVEPPMATTPAHPLFHGVCALSTAYSDGTAAADRLRGAQNGLQSTVLSAFHQAEGCFWPSSQTAPPLTQAVSSLY